MWPLQKALKMFLSVDSKVTRTFFRYFWYNNDRLHEFYIKYGLLENNLNQAVADSQIQFVSESLETLCPFTTMPTSLKYGHCVQSDNYDDLNYYKIRIMIVLLVFLIIHWTIICGSCKVSINWT